MRLTLSPVDLYFIFTACVACKSQVQNRLKIQFVKLDFSNLIFQKSSADQQGVKFIKYISNYKLQIYKLAVK